MTRDDEPTVADMKSLGWNSIEVENSTQTARIVAQQLSMIGVVLVQIRELLKTRP